MILSLIIHAQNHIYFNLFGQIRIPVLAEWFAFLGRWLGFYERGLVQMTQKTRSGIKELCSRRQCRLLSFFLLVNISSSWVPKLRIDLCWLPSLVWVVYRSNRWKSPAWRKLSYKKNRKDPIRDKRWRCLLIQKFSDKLVQPLLKSPNCRLNGFPFAGRQCRVSQLRQ
jgi:hypothetical protein